MRNASKLGHNCRFGEVSFQSAPACDRIVKAIQQLDRELERRGHGFVRYADDCNIYVRSERAGQRVMESVTRFITQKLKLKVNETKSAVAQPQERQFLGFSLTAGPRSSASGSVYAGLAQLFRLLRNA